MSVTSTLFLALLAGQTSGPFLDINVKRVEYVRFHSVIDDASVDRLAGILKEDDIVDLQGPGGFFLPTVRMADLIHERRARVRVTGECGSGCAIVWMTAPGRIVRGFEPVTLHGSPVTGRAYIREHPHAFTLEEREFAERNGAIMETMLERHGVATWLFHCAYRLQNVRHEMVGTLDDPSDRRFNVTSDYSHVWFPRAILEAAGVRQLEAYDPPSARQKADFERPQFAPRRRVYWAGDSDCDQERAQAAPVT